MLKRGYAWTNAILGLQADEFIFVEMKGIEAYIKNGRKYW